MSELKKTNKYDDIINLPHHRSNVRPHMSLRDRAAQFAPFSALTGLEDELDDTAQKSENLFNSDTIREKIEEEP